MLRRNGAKIAHKIMDFPRFPPCGDEVTTFTPLDALRNKSLTSESFKVPVTAIPILATLHEYRYSDRSYQSLIR